MVPSAVTRTTPPPLSGYRLTVPSDATASRLLRDFLVTLLHLHRRSGLVDDARLCLSEVVTNVYRHTDSPEVRLNVVLRADRLIVRVTDDRPCVLPTEIGPPDAEHGRGLTLVRALANRSGSWVRIRDGRPAQKIVWFVLRGGEPGSGPRKVGGVSRVVARGRR